MKKMLITGGTVFVSRYAAEYFANQFDVYVLNRNTRQQCEGVSLIEGDRHHLGRLLENQYFDVVLDVTAYDAADVEDLLDAISGFENYILISSSAVYPEYAPQPFPEDALTAPNKFWGKYGTDKIAAETALLHRVPKAYILRPPYLYGPGNNVYREAFVFDCAKENRAFYLPGDGSLKLQFFHVKDLCRLIEILLRTHPEGNVFNVGNAEAVTIRQWVTACYHATGKEAQFVPINRDVEWRRFFPFYAYEYYLDVEKMRSLMPNTVPLEDGLKESFSWYEKNHEKVNRKPLIEYIDSHLKET